MKFLLDTDSVSSVGSAITNISTSASSIADECNGYSTDCSEFDFTSAKSTIVSNVRNMADRIRNTSAIIEGIVAAHSGIQAYTFEQYLNPPTETEEDGSTSGGGSRSGGSRRGRSSSGSRSYSPGSTYEEPVENVAEFVQVGTATTAYDRIRKVSYAKVDRGNLSTESKAILKNAVKESGYMLIGGRYALACSSSIGKVGDVIRFKGSDGKEVQCVVTVNTVADNNKNKAYFLVDDKNKDLRPLELADILTKDDTKVKNLGNYKDVKPVETTMETIESKVAESVTAVATDVVATNPSANTQAVNTETTKDNTPVDSNNTEGGVVNA